MQAKVVMMPRDGIGVEVVAEGVLVLQAIAEKYEVISHRDGIGRQGCAPDR